MVELPIYELGVAAVLVLGTSFVIYILGWYLSPKSAHSGSSQSAYACGEEASFPRLRVDVSLYKYLIYFLVLDSPVLLIAFASPALFSGNILILTLYLFIMLVSCFLLLEGGES